MSERPRLSIEISQEQADKLRSLFTWGQMRPFFSAIVEGFIPLIEKYGESFMLLVVKGDLDMETMVRLFGKEDKDED